ncbi:hypothetical protein A2U01_0032421, partial [Trifolium medium]|nr:hypothetical protein [Trifolium medium]
MVFLFMLGRKVLGTVYDVWVVEERCGCMEEGQWEVDEGYRSPRSVSDNKRWEGDDGELFEDGCSDSDKSQSYKVLLALEGEALAVA